MMTDYIKRAEALTDFESCNAENQNWTPQRVKTLLLRQPTADVAEVVRCKGCIDYIGGMCFRCGLGHEVSVDADDFCSRGVTE